MERELSVIICTHNRCETLRTALDSFLGQKDIDYINYELIIVDNNSSDDTPGTVEQFRPVIGDRLKYIWEERKGISFARNKGIQAASGKIIMFTDDDILVDRCWLRNLYAVFQEKGCDGVGGRVLPIYPDNCPSWVKENAVKLSGSVVIYDYGDVIRKLDNTMHEFIGANIAFKREMFDEVGMFREDITYVGEDREFIRRLLKHNKELYYCGKAVIHHPVDLKRLNLRHVAKWNILLGRHSAIREYESQEERLVYWFGVPRYLLCGIVFDIIGLLPAVFHKPVLYNRWRALFRKIGMVQGYRTKAYREFHRALGDSKR